MTRKAALEREQARLLAEAEPGCDPEVLRERMPKALAFIEEWVQRADGDKLQLLLEAFRVSIKATREEAEIRAEVPLIEGVEGRNYPTIEQTSASLFRSDKIERVAGGGDGASRDARQAELSKPRHLGPGFESPVPHPDWVDAPPRTSIDPGHPAQDGPCFARSSSS